jgi:2-desacetyl-2-hydroxyethyl bacteriochlorophyllide A dehydrogenase
MPDPPNPSIDPVQARAVVDRGDASLRLEPVTLRALEPGEVRVRHTLSCVSPGTELRVHDQHRGDPAPTVPGYARVGQVEAVHGDAPLQPGDRVIVTKSLDYGGLTAHWGAHISHSICTSATVLRVPDTVSDRDAVLARLSAIPFHGWRLIDPQPGTTVAIVGLGAIGMPAAKFFADSGCPMLALDRSAQRVEAARAWGIDAEVGNGPIGDQVKRRMPEGVDVLVDATGVPAVAAGAGLAIRMPAWHEPNARPVRYLVQGSYADTLPLPYQDLFMREAHVIFSRDWEPQDLRLLLERMADGGLSFDPLPTHNLSPDDADQAYDLLRKAQTPLTVIFDWE